MYFYLNRITYQCPEDVVNGKLRIHREIHGRFWADESESMLSTKRGKARFEFIRGIQSNSNCKTIYMNDLTRDLTSQRV